MTEIFPNVLVSLLFVNLILTIMALVHAASTPAESWRAARQSRILWILLIIVTQGLGAVIYLVLIRPRLPRPRAGS